MDGGLPKGKNAWPDIFPKFWLNTPNTQEHFPAYKKIIFIFEVFKAYQGY